MVDAQGKPCQSGVSAVEAGNLYATPNLHPAVQFELIQAFKLVCSPDNAPNLDHSVHTPEMHSYFVNLINRA